MTSTSTGPTLARRWVLAARPNGRPGADTFRLESHPLPALRDGEARVRTLYTSIDPTHRIWISDVDQYMPPIAVGAPIRGSALGVVEASRVDGLAKGTLISGFWGWQSHVVLPQKALRHRVPAVAGVPDSAWLSVLGGTGYTAWFGLHDVARPRTGETLVVSAAAGAVGSIAAQLGKLAGCRVVGIAGTDEKCRWLVEEAGLDAAINRRTEDVGAALDRHCPDGIDLDFENVGGPILDAVLERVNVGARIAVCGLIAGYDDLEGTRGPRMFRNVMMKRVRIEGFIVLDFARRFAEAQRGLLAHVQAGELVWNDHVVDGLERAPELLGWLLDGKNTGKLMVRV